MNKIISWFLGLTKLGKVVTPVQQFLSGKKVYLAAGALALPALITILSNFAASADGIAYLVSLPHTPEYKALMEGIAGMALRAAVTKAADPTKDPNVGVAK